MFSTLANRRRILFLCVALLTLVIAITLSTESSATKSEKAQPKGLIERTVSYDESLPNYDIREQRGAEFIDLFREFRSSVGSDAAIVASIRESFVRGEERLKSSMPHVRIEYNHDIRTPEVIAPQVWVTEIEWLSFPSSRKRSEILLDFVKQNNELIGVNDRQAEALNVAADYENPSGNMSFAHLEQLINGIPVFRGEIKAGFTKDGRIITVINNLAAGLDYNALSQNFGDPRNAVTAAAENIRHEFDSDSLILNEKSSTDLKSVFGEGDWATTAEKMYFPTEPGVAIPAWRVLIWRPVNAYYVIVGAETRTILWRKNITEDQTQTATYNVYTNPNALVNSADSPNPLTPGPLDPALGTQGPRITRSTVMRIGNEAPYTFNNNGWITDGANITDGNAVESGMDRDITNGVDATRIPTGTPSRTFNFMFGATDNPGNPVNNTGEIPSPNAPTPCVAAPPAFTDYQRASAVQQFYVMNLYHDELYRLGFTEPALNFQLNNFGRGGTGADRVSAEGQDCSGTNNANFSTPADGQRGRMQMYLWNGPTPDFDGTIDTDIVIHEVTHGTSNRLHGNASGLGTNMSRGMGEGWSDFYGHAMLSEPTDPINGIYTTGGYATYLAVAGFTGNYYYGIRRFPKAVRAFTGGPLNRPHNPLTFADIDSLDANITDGAFARGPFGSATFDAVHNLGEVWSSALWEVRCRMVIRRGHAAGTQSVLQVVTDGMKLSPLNPTFLQARDAIITAAAALPRAPEAVADVADVREGFRIRGMGSSATIENAGTGADNTRVTESFITPTAANVSVAGRVVTAGGRGIPKAVVTITDPLGNTRQAVTNPFGYYRFDGVQVGESYVFAAAAKGYEFQAQVITVNDEIADLDFTAITSP